MARHTTTLFEADLRELVAKYEGRISTAEGIGVLMLKVHELSTVAHADSDDDEAEDA